MLLESNLGMDEVNTLLKEVGDRSKVSRQRSAALLLATLSLSL